MDALSRGVRPPPRPPPGAAVRVYCKMLHVKDLSWHLAARNPTLAFCDPRS